MATATKPKLPAETTAISLSNFGPVAELSIPVPKGGGVVILKGRNGRGKTETLSAIQALATGGKPDTSVRDGQRMAEASGFGAMMTLGRSAKHSGELRCETLEGKLDISDLANPPIKDAAAADARRIKAIVQLSGIKPDAELFVQLAGDRAAFDLIVPPKLLDTPDILVMSARIKDKFEEAARVEEAAAKTLYAKVEAIKATSPPETGALESDPEALQAALEDAIRLKTRLETQDGNAIAHLTNAAAARDRMTKAKAAYTGLTIEEAEDDIATLKEQQAADDATILMIRKQLAAAESKGAKVEAELRSATQLLTAAKQHELTIYSWGETIKTAEGVLRVPQDEIDAASLGVTQARQAVEAGALARQRAKAQAEAQEIQEQGIRAERRGAKLRDAARGTDDVLSSLVAKAGSKLAVEAGRLVTPTKRGKNTFFADLSEGERYTMAIDIGVDAFKAVPEKLPLLVLPGSGWAAIDPINQAAIHAHAVSRNAVILVELATADEEIKAEVYS